MATKQPAMSDEEKLERREAILSAALDLLAEDDYHDISIARIGYQALQRGRLVIVPGLLNSLMAIFIPLTPRPLVLRMGRQLIQH